MVSKARQLAQKAGVPSGRRNLLINGAMNVAQRGTSFTAPSDASVICDRWALNHSNDAVVDWSQSTDAPDGFRYSMKADVTTADTDLGASQYSIMYYKGTEVQDVEHLLYGTSGAKRLTLSFWVKSSKTGTYTAELAFWNGSAQVEHSKAYTINATNTWEKKELTFDANTTDSFGNAANGQGLIIYFWLAAGTTWQGSPRSSTWDASSNNRATGNVNFLDNTSNDWYITGVQLEVGSVATEFEHRSYGEELALCQRYFEYASDKNHHAHPCWIYSSSGASSRLFFTVEKRSRAYSTGVEGTIGTASSDHRFYSNGNYKTFTGMSANSSSGKSHSSVRLDFSGLSGVVSGDSGGYYNTGSDVTTSNIYVDDEL